MDRKSFTQKLALLGVCPFVIALLQTIELQNPTIFIASAHAILTKPYSKQL